MIKNKLIYIFAGLFYGWFWGSATVSQAAEFFVRAGAEGSNNGSSWENAWNELDQINWGNINPGDTVEIAAGTYATQLTITASGTEGSPVTIRRTDDVMYVGQVNIHNYIDILASQLVIDGIVNNGIIQSIPNAGGYIDEHYIDIDSGTGIILRNMEIIGPGYIECHQARGIQGTSNDITVDNLNIHDFSAVAIRMDGNDGFLVQNSRLRNILSKGDVACQAERGVNVHSEHIAVFGGVRNFELKNSVLSQDYTGDLEGGAGISLALLAGGYARVHGNVFFNLQYPVYVNSDGLGTVDDYVVNANSFVGYRIPIGDTPDDVRNNIFCNLDSHFSDDATRYAYTGGSHNLYCDDDRYRSSYQSATESQVLAPGVQPFINYLSDWQLQGATDPGDLLPVQYNTDYYGHSRGVDGVWDRGAYELVGESDIIAPNRPNGLVVQ